MSVRLLLCLFVTLCSISFPLSLVAQQSITASTSSSGGGLRHGTLYVIHDSAAQSVIGIASGSSIMCPSGFLYKQEMFPSITVSDEISEIVPAKDLILHQNYPNPFNPSTTISYYLPDPCHTRLTVYESNGKQVRSLCNEMKQSGSYTVSWNGTNDLGSPVGSGIYFVRLQAGDEVLTKKLVLLR